MPRAKRQPADPAPEEAARGRADVAFVTDEQWLVEQQLRERDPDLVVFAPSAEGASVRIVMSDGPVVVKADGSVVRPAALDDEG